MSSNLPVKLDQAMQSLDLSRVGEQINVLGPRSVVFASEGMRLRAVEVRLSTKPDDGDVYPAVGGGGKLSLSKNGLLKLSSAKGIIWSPTDSRMVPDAPPCEACVTVAMRLGRQAMCPHNVGFRAVGAWLDPAGQWEVHYATRYWCWDEELAEVRRLYRKQVQEGRIDQAQYDLKVEDEFNKRFRDRFTLAETKAMLRVIRQIGVKPAYSPQELNKGFLCVRVEPDMSVEEARRRGMASAAQIFGAATQPVAALPLPDFSQATEAAGPDDDEPEPEQGEQQEPAGQPAPPESEETQPGQQGQMPLQNESDQVSCDDCGTAVADNVVAYCQSARGRQQFGGRNYCFRCQDKHRGGARRGAAA
jgi:hypothetical protein